MASILKLPICLGLGLLIGFSGCSSDLATTETSTNANVLSYIPELRVSEETQATLKAVALDFHHIHLPCP